MVQVAVELEPAPRRARRACVQRCVCMRLACAVARRPVDRSPCNRAVSLTPLRALLLRSVRQNGTKRALTWSRRGCPTTTVLRASVAFFISFSFLLLRIRCFLQVMGSARKLWTRHVGSSMPLVGPVLSIFFLGGGGFSFTQISVQPCDGTHHRASSAV